MSHVLVVLLFQELGDVVDDAGREDAVPLVEPPLLEQEPGRFDAARRQLGQALDAAPDR